MKKIFTSLRLNFLLVFGIIFCASGAWSQPYDMFFWITEEGSPLGLSDVTVTIDGVTATSGFDGLALFEGYAPGTYDYTAEKDGYITQSGSVTIVDQNIQEFVGMTAQPQAYDMFFWITEEGSPLGLSDVTVTIDGVTATSGFDGLALFEGYAPGTYDYTAEKDGYITQSGSVTIVDQNIQEFVGMTAQPQTYDMFFWITEDGSPLGLSDVTVTIDGVTATSGFDGLALFEGYAPGTYDYTAEKDGYITQSGSVTIVDQNIQEFVGMTAQPQAYDMFFWITEEGSPLGLSDVTVTIDGVTTTSGFDGLALFEGYAPGTYDYTAEKDGYITQSGSVTIVDQNIQEFVGMTAQPQTYDMFFWITEEGSPLGLSDVTVTIDGVTATSGFDGLALFEGYAPGTYDYTAEKDGYITQSGSVTIVDQNIQEFVGMTAQPQTYDMFFWITEDGSPLGLSDVTVTIDGVTATSGFDGLALFEGYAPGTYDYTAEKDGYITQSGSVTIVDQNIQEFVGMTAQPQAYDMFFWITEEGSPLGLSDVTVTIDGVTATSGFDGLALFEGYAPGTYDYTAEKDGYITQSGSVTIVDQNIQEFVGMTAQPQTYDMFFWITEDGSPLGLSDVTVTIDGVTATSGFDGLALFEGYAPGTYDYTAEKDGYITQSGSVTIVDQNIQEFVGMTAQPQAYDMFFWITEDGSPLGLSDVTVTIDGVTATSGFDGLALFEGYAPGTYDYTAEKDGYITQSGSVTIVDQNIQEFVGMVLENYSIYFTVDNGETVIEGAEITLNGFSETTDINGQSTFEGLASGTYEYTISSNGYVVHEASVTIESEDVYVSVSLIVDQIAENILPDLNYYPNPASQVLIIEGAIGATIQLINISGKNVFSEKVSSTSLHLDLSDFPNGSYLLRYQTNNGFVAHPLIIQH